MVIELIAAGRPLRMSDDVYTYLDTSFRTASYKCTGTVFNPKLEKNIRKLPPPVQPMMVEYTEKTPLFYETQANEPKEAGWASWLCCSS